MLKPSFHKRYEFSNHASTSLSTGASISLSTGLGNVLAVISDRKLLVYDGDSFLYNIADVTNATDYSPFGAPLPGRVYNTPTNITSDTTAWIKGWEPSTVSTSYVGNRLKVDVSTLWAGIRRSIKTVPGHNYVFKTTVDLHTAGSVYIFARRMSPNNTSGNIKVIHTSVSGTYEVHFTALDTITYLHVEEGGSYTSGTVTFYLENTLVQDKQLGGKSYRFGFNGKEKDDETYGDGNAYDFGARIYDARLGRWLSVDPLQAKYPDLSPYVFAASNPIIFIDPDGRYINYFASTGIKEFKLALASTSTGRLAWAALVESKTQVVVKVTNDVLVERDQAGNFLLVSGLTENQGKLNKPENGVAYFDKSIITISKGNYRLKKEIEESTGKKFEELSAEEKNSAISAALSSGNYSISEVSNGKTIPLKPEQFPNVKVALPPYENPDPLPDETEAEYMNRISVHEAVHGEHNAIEQYKAGGKASESQLEVVPNNLEKSTIREQKGQRKKKGE